MALGFVSRLAGPEYIVCYNKDCCGSYHLNPTTIQKAASLVDLLVGIALLVVAFLAIQGTIPLSPTSTYVVLGVGAFQMLPLVGRLLSYISYGLSYLENGLFRCFPEEPDSDED